MAEKHEPVVRLSNVVKTYGSGRAEVHALRGISLSIPARRFAILVGASGSGKTTLLNLMGCMDRPTGGLVEIAGVSLELLRDNASSDFRAQNIGFIFQSFSLIPVLSAYENVEYPLLLAGMKAGKRRRTTLAMLEAVGLANLRHRRPNELSGGQKQRVAIARALVKQPVLVLADEPTANLDSVTGAAIIELMHKMQAEQHTTFVLATHDAQLMSHADETYTIRDGEIVQHTGGAAS